MTLSQSLPQGSIEAILITALITTILVGIFGKRVAESVLSLLLRPIHWVADTVYRWISPRNPFSLSVLTYKRHLLRSSLARIESPIGINLTVELERAFAPLKLISSDGVARVDLFSYAREAFRSMVLGGPGTGKTTLMKSLVINTVSHRFRPSLPEVIPVFVVLRNLARSRHSVSEAIVATFAAYHFPGAKRFVESALDAGRMLIILDGLDEVGAARDFVVQEIRRFCEYDDQRKSRNRLFVTCRQYSYRTRDLGDVISDDLHVEPFGSEHMRAFLQGWPPYHGRTAKHLLPLIQADAQIRDICRNPLLLTLLTGLYLVSERFELPTSRPRFYEAAIDELLIHRPARRGIRQAFAAEDKRQVLERVSLDRLESFLPTDDPEEFSLAVLRKHISDLLPKKTSARDFVKELVEVNGILKPLHEDSFTCAHRTIQEYFAAREAVRHRTVEEILLTTANRPELIEMLYFYCGLVENIPALTQVISALRERQQWIVAGRALAQMNEPPSAAMVDRVAEEIRASLVSGNNVDVAMEVLTTLASRRDPAFSGARLQLQGAVNELAAQPPTGASALETALSASPEIALHVIPVLMAHQEQRWQLAAIRLLGHIGTDESLDQLVRLLESPDMLMRAFAAWTIADIMPKRSRDIAKRAHLLQDRSESFVWPLPKHFPSRIMIPMAEALATYQINPGNTVVDLTTRAASSRPGGDFAYFFPEWKHIARDVKWRSRLRSVARGVRFLAACVAILPAIAAATLFFAGDRAFVVSISRRPPIQEIADARPSLFWLASDRVAAQIERDNPPAATGWKRLLPGYWDGNPSLPDRARAAYVGLHRWPDISFDAQTLKSYVSASTDLDGIAAAPELKELRRVAAPLVAAADSCADRSCVIFFSGLSLIRAAFVFVLTAFIAGCLYSLYRKYPSPQPPTFKSILIYRLEILYERSIPRFELGLGIVFAECSFFRILSVTELAIVLSSAAALVVIAVLLEMGRVPRNRVLDLLVDEASHSGIPPLY